ncbi:MAG: DEAD/DEAH box helicase [archaeon]|nr:DEAD/DEAH box helicase [archaeon]
MESKPEDKKIETVKVEEAKTENDKVEDKKEEPLTVTAAVKTTNEDIENTVEENDLISKDLTWDELGVSEEIKKALLEMEFIKPSKIQSTTFPLVMKNPPGHLIAQAKNGAGKTGAFGIATISRIDKSNPNIQAIVFAHTRELVNQIEGVLKNIAKYTQIKITALKSDSHDLGQIVVTTPGSFEGTFIKRKKIDLLKDLKILVLDEADYMVNQETTKIICDKTFKMFHDNKFSVQVLFFSATFSQENFKTIKKYFKKANMIEIKKEELTLNNVKQLYYNAKKREDKITFVEEYLKRNIQNERVIIFVNTKEFTVRLQQTLREKGYKVFILMGGDMDPKERDATIKKFEAGEIQILITTNLLARGYDERLIKLVINFDVPTKPDPRTKAYVADVENYLHRIGRTGRFGTKGIGLTLLSGDQDLRLIRQIEEFYQIKMEEITDLEELLKQFKEYLLISY